MSTVLERQSRAPEPHAGNPVVLPPQLARALERERRDLVMSLRALAAVLREGGGNPAEEAVLARMLDAQIVQLSVLTADLAAALQIEEGEAGTRVPIVLEAAVESALAGGSGRPVLIGDVEAVTVLGHPSVVVQLLHSILAMSHRVAERSPVVSVRALATRGVVAVDVPTASRGFPSSLWSARFRLLHRIAQAEGGRIRTHRSSGGVSLSLALPRLAG